MAASAPIENHIETSPTVTASRTPAAIATMSQKTTGLVVIKFASASILSLFSKGAVHPETAPASIFYPYVA